MEAAPRHLEQQRTSSRKVSVRTCWHGCHGSITGPNDSTVLSLSQRLVQRVLTPMRPIFTVITDRSVLAFGLNLTVPFNPNDRKECFGLMVT
jgi:hypothetical protein